MDSNHGSSPLSNARNIRQAFGESFHKTFEIINAIEIHLKVKYMYKYFLP